MDVLSRAPFASPPRPPPSNRPRRRLRPSSPAASKFLSHRARSSSRETQKIKHIEAMIDSRFASILCDTTRSSGRSLSLALPSRGFTNRQSPLGSTLPHRVTARARRSTHHARRDADDARACDADDVPPRVHDGFDDVRVRARDDDATRDGDRALIHDEPSSTSRRARARGRRRDRARARRRARSIPWACIPIARRSSTRIPRRTRGRSSGIRWRWRT